MKTNNYIGTACQMHAIRSTFRRLRHSGQDLTLALTETDQLILVFTRPSTNDDGIAVLQECTRLAANRNGHLAALCLFEEAPM